MADDESPDARATQPNNKGDQAQRSSPPTNGAELIGRFLEGVERFPSIIFEGMMKQCSNEDERLILRTFHPTTSNQFNELAAFVRQKSQAATPQQRRDIDQFLRLASITTLAESAAELTPAFSSPLVRIGISDILHQIKKALGAILDILGVGVSDWLTELEDLIDEIANAILSLGSPRLGSILSRKEQEYLAERIQVVRLRRERRHLLEVEEDDLDNEHY